MKATNFIRAVVSFSFGSLVYLALTLNSTSQAADDLQRTVETSTVAAFSKAPKPVKTMQERSEKFVASAPAVRTPFSTAPKKTHSTPPPPKKIRSTPPLPKETDTAPPPKETRSVFPPKPKQVESRTPDSAVSLADAREKRLEEQAKAQVKAAKVAKDLAIKKAKEVAERKAKEKAEKERKEKEERERKAKEAAAAKRERESMEGVPVPRRGLAAGFGDTGSWSRYHTGLDFQASYGTPVRAVADGTIVYAGNKGNWAGNFVVIRHSSGKKTLYAHMSSISKHGGHVEQGEKIGRVGRSGRAFGAHLHLELYPASASAGDVYSAINPRSWLRGLGVRL